MIDYQWRDILFANLLPFEITTTRIKIRDVEERISYGFAFSSVLSLSNSYNILLEAENCKMLMIEYNQWIQKG